MLKLCCLPSSAGMAANGLQNGHHTLNSPSATADGRNGQAKDQTRGDEDVSKRSADVVAPKTEEAAPSSIPPWLMGVKKVREREGGRIHSTEDTEGVNEKILRGVGVGEEGERMNVRVGSCFRHISRE